MFSRLKVADKHSPLQMRRCFSAACKMLGWERRGLIIPIGGSDGFFHLVFVTCNYILEDTSTNSIIDC